MKTFDFRLKRVLEYRRLTEEWAKDAYLDARARRLEAEIELMGIHKQKHDLLNITALTIEDLQTQELRFTMLDDREMETRVVVNVLIMEEDRAMDDWNERKQEVAALEKLHDKAYEEWSYAMNKEEQDQLDEWSNQRRAA